MQEALPIREATVTLMRASAGITALVPAASIHGERIPVTRTWPFIAMGDPILTPERGACWNGTRVGLTIHGFVEGQSNDGVATLGGVLRLALDGAVLPLVSGERPVLEWTGGQLLADEDKDKWHVVATFDAV